MHIQGEQYQNRQGFGFIEVVGTVVGLIGSLLGGQKQVAMPPPPPPPPPAWYQTEGGKVAIGVGSVAALFVAGAALSSWGKR